ncbi:putative disease resistance RPP13-like protein 1 [Rutidosis leptorrhynchoides]|uniref:putative disease resistance RPP13-like protein 1 n=1 Tax=Rutidosis leptorrhynchoides TaxID=125765 RepID=UPI003A9A5091
MAEIVITAAVTVLIEKLLSVDLKKLTRSEKIESQLQDLKTNWELIEAVLADANEKHITQEAVKKWLQELRHLAYDIEDVLDDMATETIRRKLKDEARGNTSTGKVLKKITNFTVPRKLVYGHKMRSKLDVITVKLNDLVNKKNLLGLDVNVKVQTRSSHTTTSLVNVSKVLGRENDKKALLEMLLGDESRNQDVSVVSIVGMGGMGKTTLAQVLYNNETVKDHFESMAWVCVSDDFDVLAISKEIYHSVTVENKTYGNLNLLHEDLKEKLSNKRFLIVLDDVWSEDPKLWETLEQALVGAPGSKVIVTTRSANVARAMKCSNYHELKDLSDEYALSLLANYALDEPNFDKHQSLIPIAQGIIEKCGGLPLALKAIGRALNNGKGNDKDEWKKLLESEIWSSDDRTGILPALKLSYYALPLHLKQLFAYCCLFPKDYKFNKKELVLLWMAEGFLNQPRGNMSMESLGRKYFEELHSRSFFQQHSAGNESKYTMHDLMNDLAISVAGDFFYFLDAKMDVTARNEAFEKFRHFSFIGERNSEYRKFKELHKSKCLRTFLPVSNGSIWRHFDTLDNVLVELLPKLQFLRVLCLTWRSITEVPQSVGDLKHLRYLNFSRTDIEKVPEKVSELYNLQSLLVRECRELVSLPVSFVWLKNLRHLDMTYTPLLNKTPLEIGQLTSLQTLSKVIIERANGFKLSDLKGLLNIEGQLSIKGLEKVTDPHQADDANLQAKGLVNLDMEWSHEFDESRDSKIEYEVFQRLRPPTKLNKLKIFHYGGMEFPSWFIDPSFDKLTELTIDGCINCTHLTGSFAHLLEICIENCPKLVRVSVGSIPSLEVLVVEECSEAVFRDIVCASSAIQSLTLRFIEDLTKLDGEVLKHLVKLQTLSIHACHNLVSIGEIEVTVGSSNMKSSVLREVYLSFCDSLESYNCPNSVEILEIKNCDSMASLTLSTTLHELPSSLEDLEIWYCKNLISFPHEYLQSLTSLKSMKISNCPSMDVTFTSGLPPNLRSLEIGELKKPISEWGLQNYPTSLAVLTLDGSNSGVTSFAMEGDETNTSSTSFLLPPSLTFLHISNFEDVQSISDVVLQHLTHLQRLTIKNCPNIRDAPQTTSSLKVSVWYNSPADV